MDVGVTSDTPSTFSIAKLESKPENDMDYSVNYEYFDHSSVIHKNLKTEPEDEDKNEDPLRVPESNFQQSENEEAPFKTEDKSTELNYEDTPLKSKFDSSTSTGTINEAKICVKEKRIPREERGPYPCRLCTESFRTGKQYEDHFRIHTQKTGEKAYKCDTCDNTHTFTTNNKNYLLAHQRRKHNIKPYKCKMCGECFGYNTSLRDHNCVYTQHVKEKLKCEVCGVRFLYTASLTDHKEKYHINTEKQFSCEICRTSFKLKSTLEDHKMIHTGEKPFKCDVCGMCFPWKLSLDVHKVNHAGETPFKCETVNCGQRFPTYVQLAAHRRYISNCRRHQQ